MASISSIKTEKLLLNIFYILPVFLGIGAFIPNFFLIIFSLVFIYLLLTKEINKKIFQNKFIKILLLFWLISIISSIFSDNKIVSLISSVSYLRFICFAVIVHWLLEKNKIDHNKFFKILLYSMTFIIFFAYLELFSGYNIIINNIFDFFKTGPIQHPPRITGLFGDEQVLGGYLLRIFLFMMIIYFFVKKKISNFNNFLFIFLIFSFYLFIILSGERSSIFLLILASILIVFLINGHLKIKMFGILTFIFLLIILVYSKPELYNRLITQTFKLQIYSKAENKFYFFSKIHEAHYKTAINIFLDKPLIGSGNKSFRFLCDKNEYSHNVEAFDGGNLYGKSKGCATHPHNFYLQVLSENGIINFLLLIFFYILIIKQLSIHLFKKLFIKSEHLSNKKIFIYIFFAVLLWPIIPSGSFFSSWIVTTLYLPAGYLIGEFKKQK